MGCTARRVRQHGKSSALLILVACVIMLAGCYSWFTPPGDGDLPPVDNGTTAAIALLVESSLTRSIADSLSVFKEDLTVEGYRVIERAVERSASPREVRDILESLYRDDGQLVGAFLVGDIPAAYFEARTGDYSNPNALEIFINLDATDMYYMDLDGGWEYDPSPDVMEGRPANVVQCTLDPSVEAFSDRYIVYLDEDKKWDYSQVADKGQYEIEIWVSRIMGHNLAIPGANEASVIRDYFEWNHLYRTGHADIADKANLIGAIDGTNEQGMDWSALCANVARASDVSAQEFEGILASPGGAEVLYLTAHSTPQAHQLLDTTITTSDLAFLPKNAVFYLLNACSACRWDQYVMSPSDPNYLGGMYVFSKTQQPSGDFGICAIGFAGVGGFNWLSYFTEYLNSHPGSSYGEAFRYWFNRNLPHIFGIWNYVIIGDPTIDPEVTSDSS